MFFQYGAEEINYLKQKDKKLGKVIEEIGHIERPVDTDLFSSVVHHIIGQQISTKAQQSIWKKMNDELGVVDADAVLACGRERLQKFGITYKKADYILDFSQKMENGSFDLQGIADRTDEEAIAELASLKGIGIWTAEMILLFCLQRPNVFSFGDLAILRGMRMVYHHREISRERFEKYRRRFSPCCSVASLYFWAVAGGAIEGMKDYAPKEKRKSVEKNEC
jgi:3-methyladenine DNA glycosylase/8-oxoguanine DNA glycosylase